MKGVIVIGTFDPGILPELKGVALVQHLKPIKDIFCREFRMGRGMEYQIREPFENLDTDYLGDGSAFKWHRDCNADIQSDPYTKSVLFWSNAMPIEFMRTGVRPKLWSPEPGEVILFDNTDQKLLHSL